MTAFPLTAHAAHGIALWDDLKYQPGFAHFDYVNPDAPKGGTLKLSVSAAFDSVTPFILKGIGAPGVAGYVYQSLMTPSYDEPQSYYPLIASSITLSADRATADLELNQTARWNDGKAITAEDVVWSFAITIEATGPHSVRFHFLDKEHRELPLIAAALPVLPKHYFCEGNDNAAGCVGFEKTTLTPPLGSGPYAVSAIEPGRSITLTRVRNYWAENLPTQKGLNNFDTIRYDVYRDDTVSLEGIKSHQFDFYEEFIARNWATSYNVPAVKSGQMIKSLIPNKIPRGMQGFIFNTRLPKFSDRRVREAIGLTLDFEWMNQTLFYGAYDRNKSFFGNTEFEAKGLPGADELTLLSPYRCHTHPSEENKQAHPQTPHSPPAGESTRSLGAAVGGNATTESPHEFASATSAPPPGGSRESAAPLQLTRTCLPESLFTTEYKVPTTDGSGIARSNLIRAQQLLDNAGWVIRDGKRVNATTGEKLTIEFLMTQRTFERVVSIMRHNLLKLGIDSTFRYIDASQYERRVEMKQFEIVSVWWNLGLFYPSTEQYLYWHSSQAAVDGSQNLSGAKSPAIDALTTAIQNAQKLDDLRAASRALDRVLTNEYYIIPHWTINAWRVAYWDQFGRPKITPAYNLGLDTWWQAAPAGTKKVGAK